MEMPSLSRTRASPKGKSVFGETATIWAQDDVREFERIATQQNAIESEVQKQDYPDSEIDDWDWDEIEASPFKETTTAIKRPAKLLPPTENNHEVKGGNRQDDYSDHEVDNLDWEVLQHPQDTDTKPKVGQHKPTTLKPHMSAETSTLAPMPRQMRV